MTPVEYAFAELLAGVAEIPGPRHNQRILEYHQATSLKATDDETPWCAAFVNWCLRMARVMGTGKANARSFMQWGVGVAAPYPGCIIVLWRGHPNGWQGHVGFYMGRSGELDLVLGGNQGNAVSVRGYDRSRLLGYREAA